MYRQKMKFNEKVFFFYRERRKMTLREVGEAIGVSRQTVQKWEAGKVIPRKGHVQAVAKLFGISVYDISDLPPEEEIASKTEKLQTALSDPMFEIVVNNWGFLTAADKGEIIADLVARAEKGKSSISR